MEARALAHFTAPGGPLSSLGQSSSISVPELLYHSRDHHVLVLKDLGPLITLPEYLATVSDDAQTPNISFGIGSRIGEFFAKLHSPASIEKANQATNSDLENSFVEDVINQVAVLPVRSYLLQYGIPNAQDLFRRVLEDHQRATTPVETCFVLGDFTPGAVLTTASGDREPPIGIIDWEFSGQGRGVNGDMAQFLASLHLSLIAASPETQSHEVIKLLIAAVCSAYHYHSPEWLKKGVGFTSNERKARISSDASEYFQIFRSALILHGREMINNAIERPWPSSIKKETNVLVQEMVRKGAWYIERAEDDVGKMLEAENWEQLLKEENRIMLNLFGIK